MCADHFQVFATYFIILVIRYLCYWNSNMFRLVQGMRTDNKFKLNFVERFV